MHNKTWGPYHHAEFQKKLMSQSQENFWTDARTEGRMDQQTIFHRTLPATTRGTKESIMINSPKNLMIL